MHPKTRPHKSRLLLKSIACLIVSLSLYGCSSVGPGSNAGTPKEEDYSLLGVATTGIENLSLSRDTRFAWRAPVKVVGIENDKAAEILAKTIEENLTAKGFSISSSDAVSYQLSAVALLGEPEEHSGDHPDPGIQSRAGAQEMGSLVISILSNQGQPLWKGTAQLFTSDEFAPKQRVERARVAVERLLVRVVPQVAETIKCTDPRPQYCTMIYKPVCGHMEDNSVRDFPSGCSACSDPRAESYVPGKCPGSQES
ncbi:hypothetical protein [Hahella sp. CCB-MM4]|uniref:hypothetical protein n=1 Tax=Hahella sp. (strain CCB-MM4) TaxID=1926491 RepID=UPI00143D4468|nr:hypothetical protein [Hahella sp. CCB-MM4]